MTVFVFLLCLFASMAAEPRPGIVPLFADQAWYREAKAAEAVYEGILERTPTTGAIGRPGRFNTYRLTFKDGQPARELYLPGKAFLLAAHVGQPLRVVGKVVESEIWPARVELPNVLIDAPLTARDGIYARGYWRPADVANFGARQYVIRNADDLAGQMRLTGNGAADEAVKRLAGLLRVPVIDWKKYMLVSVTAGLKGDDVERLTVTRVSLADKVMTVHYRLVPAVQRGGGIGVPAETVLVDRFEGEVRFRHETAPDGPAKP